MIDIKLKKGKEKAVNQRHPWVFSGALDKVKGKPENGDVVRVLSAADEFLAYGYYNDQSRVAVRLLEWDENVAIDFDWYEQKIKTAISGRSHLLTDGETTACRLIFSEADFLPGLIVDRYADFLSVQILSSGIEKAQQSIIEILVKYLSPKGIFDRSDATARTHEGITAENGLLWGEAPAEFIAIKENDFALFCEISVCLTKIRSYLFKANLSFELSEILNIWFYYIQYHHQPYL